ncbi:MAG: pyruvate kinase alpha/beta domain-containing protein [Desulfurispora sp.]|uniref:pyruvate kinase alpha/beta domain-containing protein n=1 Tax=Desulfurispora sp. TaxID=3014275 RepID=UPI00404AC989
MYFAQKGPLNTEQTIELAVKKAQVLGITHLVVASCSGETALRCSKSGLQVVCVSHHVGFGGAGVDEMSPEMRRQLQEKGIPVLTTTHLLAGVDRGVRNKFGGVYPAEIMAQTLRMLGQGLKVCLEISVMALDAGLIPYGVDVVAIAGTGSGADTAAVIRPAHASQIFDSKIKEIICKPFNF